MITQEMINGLIQAGWTYTGVCDCSERAHKWKKRGYLLKASVRSGLWNRWKGNRLDKVGQSIDIVEQNTGIQ